MALVPLNLLVTHRGKSSRQHVTCRYKCGDACSKPVPNTSDNEYFGDIVKAVSRRSLLQAGGIAVLAVGAGSALAACSGGEAPAAVPTSSAAPAGTPPGMKFDAVAPNTEDVVVVPDGYLQAVVISWGDPILPNTPKFDVQAQTAAAQRGQFGFNNDFAGLLPVPGQKNRFLLVTNHEYVTPQFMFPRYDAKKPAREQFDIEIAAIGMGVVEVERTPQGLKPVMGPYNRRITADTPMTLTGPGAGTDFVKTPADPSGRAVAGTFANCAGGVTPWGTVLSGEENFHSYFGAAEGAPKPSPVDADRQDRYGVALEPSELLWETFDPRFDVAKTPNEANRFGYIVELNPWDPNSTPIKHTAMGRFKHEGATIYVTPDGTVVAYCGDDERFDYMYKFVSSKKVQPGTDPAAMAHNLTILDEGTLYVAKLSSDVVKTLQLKDVGATFRYEACKDEGKPPYRGLVQIDYAHSPTYEGSQAEIQGFVDTLRREGWSTDSGFKSHAASLAKNNVVTLLRPYAPNGSGGIEVRGECRDVTDHFGKPDAVNTPLPPDALS